MSKHPLLIVVFSLITMTLFAQEDIYVARENAYGYKKWTDYMYCYRAGIGTQGSLYGELGISRLKYVFYDKGQYSHAQYFSMEWSPTILPDKPKNIYGFKLGWESNVRALALGIEAKYQTDLDKDHWIVTPKFGVGMLGIFNLFYGYNIWLNSNPFEDLGHHQLSIVFNFNSYLIKVDRSPPISD